MHDKTKAKVKKKADIEDIRAQLRGTMGTHHTHLVDEDDDEDVENEDVYMYPADMHPDERDAYRSIVSASKASNWEREQHENIVGSKRIPGVFYWYTADDAKIIVYATFASITPYCPFILQVFCSKTKKYQRYIQGWCN